MNYATEEEDDGKCGESEETLRVEDFESVNRGDWVVVTYDSKLYPGKVANKDVNGMTVPCQKEEIYYTFENVHKKIDPPFPLNSKRQIGF